MTILLVSPVVLFIVFSPNTCKKFIFNYFTQNGGEVCVMCSVVFMVLLIIMHLLMLRPRGGDPGHMFDI